jgi:hypothetical protein
MLGVYVKVKEPLVLGRQWYLSCLAYIQVIRGINVIIVYNE